MDQESIKEITFIRREIHAVIAMHALILSAAEHGSGVDTDKLASDAFAIADAMVAKGGPIE